jgi:hypothetical protein
VIFREFHYIRHAHSRIDNSFRIKNDYSIVAYNHPAAEMKKRLRIHSPA